MQKWLRSLALAGVVMGASSAQAQWKTPWSYTGPRGADHWSSLDPAYALCNAGERQSPIDIAVSAVRPADLPPLEFENHAAPLEHLVNNGATIRVNYPASGDFLTVGGKRYQLAQFHFHRPSEHLVDGKRYPMELHLMYSSSTGEVAGVAVFIATGREEATVRELWDHMPLAVNQDVNVPRVDVNPGELLPRNRAYYRYVGSVTAPPCTEDVAWFVLTTPIELSRKQIAAFAKLYPNDARPPMPLNERAVTASRK